MSAGISARDVPGLATGSSTAEPLSPAPPLFEQLWFHRSWWTAAGLMTIVWSWSLLGWVSTYPALAGLVAAASGWGVVTLLVAWTRPTSSRSSRLFGAVMWAAIALCVSAFMVWALLQVLRAPGYGTDELAFDQYAAHLLAHGVNPYSHSMAPAFPLFHVQPDGYTYQLNGTAVTTLSYPALSFLVYVPFLLLGWSTQLAVTINVVAWAVAIVVLFALLPPAMRPMAVVVGSLSVYIGFAVGGVTVALYTPLLVGAVWCWHRWPHKRGWRAWVSPGLMGLAMCVNQVPWFVLPFLVAGVAMEASRSAERPSAGIVAGARYLAIVAAVAVTPNLPFMVWDPHAWLHGILTPIVTPTVPAGQGLVALALYLHLGGGSLGLFSVLAVLAMLAALAMFLAFYRRLRPLAVLLPAIPLLLTTRSYGSYLFGLVPAALVAAVTTMDSPVGTSGLGRGAHRPGRRWPSIGAVVAGGLCLSTLAVATVATTSPSPLAVDIEGVTTTGQLATVDSVTVSVHNRSDSALRPHFTLSSGDAITTFWLAHGPSTLGPHASASYTLLAPNFYAQPPIEGGFQVVAFTSSPAAVSHSPSYLPTSDHLALEPDAVNSIVPIGQQVVFRAQVLDHLNRPVHRSGVPVYLGQVIYAQTGLEYGEAIINDGQPGQTPVMALTDGSGVATFTVTGTHASVEPVYFEANLVRQGRFYPYGYSQIVPVRFGG